MLIAEHIDDEGKVHRTTLELSDEGAVLRTNEVIEVVPVRAILLSMRRFGRPLAPTLAAEGEPLDLGGGLVLKTLRFRATVDVEPRTYLVLEGDGEPLCALSTEIAGALRFLAQKSR